MVTTLENQYRTFRLEFVPEGSGQFRVRELKRVGDSWQPTGTTIMSADRAKTVSQFALNNQFFTLPQ